MARLRPSHYATRDVIYVFFRKGAPRCTCTEAWVYLHRGVGVVYLHRGVGVVYLHRWRTCTEGGRRHPLILGGRRHSLILGGRRHPLIFRVGGGTL